MLKFNSLTPLESSYYIEVSLRARPSVFNPTRSLFKAGWRDYLVIIGDHSITAITRPCQGLDSSSILDGRSIYKGQKMERKEDLKFSYQEDDFIQSKDGRLLRVLAEYQYPNLQFEKLGVKNLIVFFGSARALNQKQTQNLIKSF